MTSEHTPWVNTPSLMPKPLPPELFLQFQQFLVEESGLYFDEHRLETLSEKLSERLQACDFKEYADYYRYLKFNSKGRLEFKNLIDNLTIGETFFFRNEAQFEVLRSHVIPKLKIWCAGCSTGEEPYSLAMLLRDFLPNLERWDLSILATDINRGSLKSCLQGIYGSRSVETVPPDYLAQHFVHRGQKYLLSDVVKNSVKFEYHNLARDPYTLPGMQQVDIIFCRNVTIYFDLKTLKKVIAQFADCLAPEGYLFIGHSETLWGVSDSFIPIEFPQTFLYQKKGAGPKGADPKGERQTALALPPSIPLPAEVKYHPPKQTEVMEPRPAVAVKKETGIEALLKKGTRLGNEGKYEKALACFQEIVAEDNLCLEAHYLIGVLLSKMEKFKEAIEPFRRVLYIDPEQVMGYFHLGNLYRFLGKQDKAKKEYHHCLKFLEGKKDEEPVSFSEGLTVGVLFQAVHRALESLNL